MGNNELKKFSAQGSHRTLQASDPNKYISQGTSFYFILFYFKCNRSLKQIFI